MKSEGLNMTKQSGMAVRRNELYLIVDTYHFWSFPSKIYHTRKIYNI